MDKQIYSFFAGHPFYSYLPKGFLDPERAVLKEGKDIRYVFFLKEAEKDRVLSSVKLLLQVYRPVGHRLIIQIVADSKEGAEEFIRLVRKEYPGFSEYGELYEKQKKGELKEKYYPLEDPAVDLIPFKGKAEDFFSSFVPNPDRFSFLFFYGGEEAGIRSLPQGEYKAFDVLSPAKEEGLLTGEDVDGIAKGVVAYYNSVLGDREKTEEGWKAAEGTPGEEANRYIALSLVCKMNLIGLKVVRTDGQESDKELDRILAQFKPSPDPSGHQEVFLNIARQEHQRFDAYSLSTGWKPMEKKDVFSDSVYHNKFKDRKLHANLVSFEALLMEVEDMKKKEKEGYKLKPRDTELIEKDLDIFLASGRILELAGLRAVKA